MSALPRTESTPLVRTDFSNPAGWAAARAAVAIPSDPDGFLAYVDVIDDPANAGLTASDLLEMAPESLGHRILIVADQVALSSTEYPFLVIALIADYGSPRGRQMRVIARELWGVENNLSLANMDFQDFADEVDDDGVFRDFRSV